MKRGIGQPGKLWTGDIPEDGAVMDARIIERKCSDCGKSARRLRAHPVEGAEAIAAACEIPTLFVTMGGVGSVASYIVGESDAELSAYQLWNWSERVGGHAILNPVAVLNGYWYESDLPKPKEGFWWGRTYRGSTLSEFVLFNRSTAHDLPVVELDGRCPPCRHKVELEATPADLMVTAADFIAAKGTAEQFADSAREAGLEERSAGVNARSLLTVIHRGDCLSDDVKLYRAAVKAAERRTATPPPAGEAPQPAEVPTD